MLVAYFILLAIFGAGWAVLFVPSLFAWLTNAAGENGTLLFHAPAFFIWLSCLAPAFLLWRSRRWRLAGIALSAAVLAAVTFGPGAISQTRVKQRTSELQAMDVRPVDGRAFRSIEFDVRFPKPYSEPCNAACRALMQSGQLDWVRAIRGSFREGTPHAASPETLLVVPAFGPDCAIADPLAEQVEFCVLAVPDHGRPAGLRYQARTGGGRRHRSFSRS